MRRQRLIVSVIQIQVDALRTTADPLRRSELLQAHWQAMADTPSLLRRVADLSLKGRSGAPGRPVGGYGSAADPEEIQRFEPLGERPEMMGRLHGHMLEGERIGAARTDVAAGAR